MIWIKALGAFALVFIVAPALQQEAIGWFPLVAARMVRAAAQMMPRPHAARYCQEWLAELEMYKDRPVSVLVLATRIFLRAPATRLSWTVDGFSPVYLAINLVLLTAYVLLPVDLARLVLPAIGLSSAAATVLGVRLNRPSRPTAWYLFAAGQLAFASGELLSFLRDRVLHLSTPSPYFPDLVSLSVYPLLAAGLLLLIRQRRPGRDRASLLDATVTATGGGLLAWVFLIVPYVRSPGLSLVDRLVSVANPFCDVVLLAVAVRLAVGPGRRPAAFWLLVVGAVALLVSDVLYGLLALRGEWQLGSPVDLGWIVFYVCWGAAALHPSMRTLSERGARGPRLTRNRLALLALASLMAPAMPVIQWRRGEAIDIGIGAVGSVVVFMLILARMADLAAELALQDERRRLLGTVLPEGDKEA
jgi:hypothetical protein